MLRGNGAGNRAASKHTQSAPLLPRHSPPRGDRVALATSISSTLLPPHVEQDTSSGDQVRRFAITDLLPQQQHQARKRAKPGAPALTRHGDETSPSAGLIPLSPIRDANFTKASSSQQQQKFLHTLERPENTELFTYASSLCHRITGRYMSREMLQRDPEAQKKEIKRIQGDPELLQAISVIKTLSKEFKDVARDTLGHRKELGHALLRIEESYLQLFEKLLELSLRMYWRYEQKADGERKTDKTTIKYWQEMHNWKAGEATKLQKLLDGKEILLRTQRIELNDLEHQCSELQKEVGDQRALEERVYALEATERELRDRERELQSDYLKLQRKHEEMVLYEREQLEKAHEQHRHLVEEMRRTLRAKDEQLSRHTKAIHELKILTTPPEVATSSCQTKVDDDGLWDKQDGMPTYVSKDVVHRLAWRRFHAYASCKNCRGRPVQQTKMALLTRDPASKETDDAYVDVWSLSRGERKTKKAQKRIDAIESQWQLPEAISLFLSNLPKTVVAFPFYSLDSVIHQIEQIYDDKYESDKADEADGVAREELPSFLCEYFLKTHGLRQSAEIGLYRFLVSAKSVVDKSSHVHLFARFCNVLTNNGDNVDAPHSNTPATVGAGTLMAALIDSPRRGYLDRSYLRVFLHARHYLLRSPPPKLVKVKKAGHTVLQPQPSLDVHVLQVDALRMWVPLDHAVAIIRWYVSFLPEDTVIAYCREVEYSTAIYAGRALTEISGNRLAVRAEMRKSMLVSGGQSEGSAQLTEKERQRQPRIVADVHRVLLLLLHALEERRGVMEKALVAMFEAGDTNHDCVLSLDEFKAIIRGRATSFSDRRLLRMFRQALMGGSEQSFALSMDAFVKVCNDHGLVTLLPDDLWADPLHERALEVAAAVAALAGSKPKTNRLTAALQTIAIKQAVPLPESSETEENAETGGDIPEELIDGEPSEAVVLSPRAEEVDEEEGEALWQWQ